MLVTQDSDPSYSRTSTYRDRQTHLRRSAPLGTTQRRQSEVAHGGDQATDTAGPRDAAQFSSIKGQGVIHVKDIKTFGISRTHVEF